MFKDLCIDAKEPAAVGRFWSIGLGLVLHLRPNSHAYLLGESAQQTIWINPVAEEKTTKLRVRLDVNAPSIEFFTRLGATKPSLSHGERIGADRTELADLEGNEFGIFVADPDIDDDYGDIVNAVVKSVVFDSVDCAQQATWWADILDANVVHYPDYSSVVAIEGTPFRSLDFVNVPDPKSVKNRIHLDLVASDTDRLVARGARILHGNDAEIPWTVMCDPEGNEFCVFAD